VHLELAAQGRIAGLQAVGLAMGRHQAGQAEIGKLGRVAGEGQEFVVVHGLGG
jgi:hypothetical protein